MVTFLLLLAGHTVILKQAIVYSPKGTNNTVNLLYGTSIYDLKQDDLPPRDDLQEMDRLRLYTAPAALIKVPEGFFTSAIRSKPRSRSRE